MTTSMTPLPFTATTSEYDEASRDLLGRLHAGDDAVAWRFKWEHPRFRDKPVTAVVPSQLDLVDARLVIAREYGFEDWRALDAFATSITNDSEARQFEEAADAVIAGDEVRLTHLIEATPAIVRARSGRRHRATLLHYIAANGVEGYRQKTPVNAVSIAGVLLGSGSDPNALAAMYDEQCTTMSMLVSSSPPAEAGLQLPLAELLLDHGALIDGIGTKWQSAVLTALTFGFPATAAALARRSAGSEDLAVAAGLGDAAVVAQRLPSAPAGRRHAALALASQLGHRAVVELLLDAGEDPNRRNPAGFHSHATPLHQAVLNDHIEVVNLLIERGASLDIRDTIYEATPLGWAEYGGRKEMVALLESAASRRRTRPDQP